MGKNTSVTLSDHFVSFVDRQIEDGRYGSVSEVVRAGLRLLEEQEAHLRSLRDALVTGELSGPSQPFDFDAFLARKQASRTE